MVGMVVEPSSAPWFFTHPPALRSGLADRPRVVAALDEAARHDVVLVNAPSGFGKTVAVAAWTRSLQAPVAWLTLTMLDADARRVDELVLEALASLGSDPVTTHGHLGSRELDAGAAVRRAIEQLPAPSVLVIDDVDAAGPAVADSVLAALVAMGGGPLTLVLVGGQEPALPLARPRMAGRVGSLGPAELRFTVEEVLALASATGQLLDEEEAVSLLERTGSWPAAVHLVLTSAPRDLGGRPVQQVPVGFGTAEADALLGALVVEQVLPGLEPELADFVLEATTCSRIDADLAQAVTGRTGSERLLQECLRRGLFLDRYADEDGAVVYRWHDAFTRVCRAELARRDLDRLRTLNRRAAVEVSARGFPFAGLEFARRARSFELAAEIMRDQWLAMVLQARGSEAVRAFAAMPSPWRDQLPVLLAHACCLDVVGERDAARLRFQRARTVAEGAAANRSVELVMALAAFFVADSAQELAAAADTVRVAVADPQLLSEPVAATALFVLGWTELRLRRSPRRAVETLALAAAECDRFGQHEIAARARLNVAFAAAFAGDFVAAEQVLDAVSAARPASDRAWRSYDGGLEPFVRGFIAYYRGQVHDAGEALRLASEVGKGVGYAPLARIYLLLLAADVRDTAELDSAEVLLDEVPDEELHGVPWGTYKTIVRAAVADARGQVDRALTEVDSIHLSPDLPVTVVLAARIYERAGKEQRALEALALLPPTPPGHIRANALVCRALIAARAGREARAHVLIERALDIAAPQGVTEPFGGRDSRLAELMRAHASWGTRHEELVASILTRGETVESLVALSRREREILAYLRTNLTTSEIAAKLFVSVNTVKTHQRAIYRKLGVTSRREAVRVRHLQPVRPPQGR